MITITIPAAAPRTLWAKREHTRASQGDQQLLFSPGEGNYDDIDGEDNHYHIISTSSTRQYTSITRNATAEKS